MDAGAVKRVFLSHTSELRDHPQPRSFVAAAEDAVKRLGLLAVDMKDFGAQDVSVEDYLRDTVGSVDVFVGIIGFKYGSLVRDSQVSFTEREYEYARARNLTRLIFMLAEKDVVQLPAEHIRDLRHGREQERFRQRLMRENLVKKVSAPAQLESELNIALFNLVRGRGGPARPVVFTAPRLPEVYVERRALASALVDRLRSEAPTTIALVGDPGSGKRTLAAYVCREVGDRFSDGVLWATLGARVNTDEKLIEKITDLAAMLSDSQPSFDSVDAAGSNLGRLLEAGRRLLVVDDVRDRDHFAPFMRHRGTRLFTTRDEALVPEGAVVVPVEPMTGAEALELMRYGLDGVEAEELTELIRISGGSPLLVQVARRAVRDRLDLGASSALAVAHVEAGLAGGPEALDAPLVKDSLRLLRDGRPERLESYLRLAVFPDAEAIGTATLARCWRTDEAVVTPLCRELVDLELVDEAPDGIRVRAGMLRVSAARLAGYHRDLLEAYRAALAPGDHGVRTAWWGMPNHEPYLWDHLERHLAAAARDGGPEAAELRALRAHPRWRDAQRRRAGRTPALDDHRAAVSAVAFSPDGLVIASADVDGRILLRTARDQTVLAAWAGHQGRVNGLAFGPDGRWLVSGGADGAVRMWGTDGRRRAAYDHAGPVNGVAACPDGSFIASVGTDRTVRLWNVAGGFPRITLSDTGPVRAVAISAEGAELATAGEDAIVVWDTFSGSRLARLVESPGALPALALSPDGSWLAAAGEGGTIHRRDARDGSSLGTLAAGGPVRALAISPDGSWLAAAGADGAVRLWDVAVEDGRAREPLTGHAGEASALDVSRTGEWLVSGGSDGAVRVWRVLPYRWSGDA